MKKILPVFAVVFFAAAVLAAPPEHYLHVKVDDPSSGERVRVNLPLSLAEKIIPAINQGHLHDGKIEINGRDWGSNDVNLPMLMAAVKSAPDGEYVTVEERDQNVRVAKSNGNLIVHVTDKHGEQNKVDVTIPWSVAEALTSSDGKQIDILAAIHALEAAGDTTLVSVTDNHQTVRVWIDSKSTSD